MLLNEIKPVLTEGQIPSHITMIMQEIIKAGKATNTVHVMLMAQLIEFFKFCGAVSIRNFHEHHPSKDLLDAVRNLAADQQSDLASWLLEKLSEAYQTGCCTDWCNPQLGLNEWVAWVLRRQD